MDGAHKGDGSLIGVIGDEDTVTGFLLAGVGDVDVRRRTNFLVVDAKTTRRAIEDAFKDLTTREDIAVVLINQTVADTIRHLVDDYARPVPAASLANVFTIQILASAMHATKFRPRDTGRILA